MVCIAAIANRIKSENAPAVQKTKRQSGAKYDLAASKMRIPLVPNVKRATRENVKSTTILFRKFSHLFLVPTARYPFFTSKNLAPKNT